MGKYYCPKCTLIFDDSRDRCPNCGYYSIYCHPYEKVKDKYGFEDDEEIKPDFDSNYIKKLCDGDHRFADAIDNYNRLDLIRYNGPLVDDKNNFCVDVHSFTRDVYYEVKGSFNEEGNQLISYSCQCDDYNSRRRCCKHLIVLMMIIYHEYCEQKYGVVKELVPKTVRQQSKEHIEKPQKNSCYKRKPVQSAKKQIEEIIPTESIEVQQETISTTSRSTLKKQSFLKHLLFGLLSGFFQDF